MISSNRWPPKFWEGVAVRAAEGHAPSFDFLLAFGRIIEAKKAAWERAKRHVQHQQQRKSA